MLSRDSDNGQQQQQQQRQYFTTTFKSNMTSGAQIKNGGAAHGHFPPNNYSIRSSNE